MKKYSSQTEQNFKHSIKRECTLTDTDMDFVLKCKERSEILN